MTLTWPTVSMSLRRRYAGGVTVSRGGAHSHRSRQLSQRRLAEAKARERGAAARAEATLEPEEEAQAREAARTVPLPGEAAVVAFPTPPTLSLHPAGLSQPDGRPCSQPGRWQEGSPCCCVPS